MNRQVPAPSAAAWLFDLSHLGAPTFCARTKPRRERPWGVHLVELGVMGDCSEAAVALANATVQHTGLIW